MAKLDVQKARDLLQVFDFGKLFVEELGWSQPTNRQSTSFDCKGDRFQRKQIAQLSGVVVLEVTSSGGKISDAKTLAAIHKEISKLHHENLLIFVDSQRTQSLWYWVKREGGKLRPREHLYVKGQPGDLFLSKLSSMVFDISEFDEAGNVSVVNVAKRLKDALDVQRVTKKFFGEYDNERLAFLDLIKGIADERERRWYASVLLNRLMFIYFLQRKGFIDEGSHAYLQVKMDECKKQFGKDQYYEEFLKPLFFKGFAVPEEARSAEVKKLLGKVKYLNGGLFLEHRIERDNGEIRIPDKAFENLLKLFQSYSWNLNDTPGGEDNEINPDVLGYIFEKYINQKAFGAYYTRPEITEYLCEQTIYRLILEKINSPGIEGLMQPRSFDSMSELLLNLDAQLCRELLNDILPTLSLLDPACGSGAFLVAAMKTLVNIYSAVIGKIQFLNDRNLSEWLRRARKEHPSVAYFIKKRIITDNLYGVDIMDEATEIARLRLFLALVASAESVDQLEPLPNIDFNILKGNSLIGLMHVDDKEFDARQSQGHLFRKSYRELLAEKNRLIDLYRHTGSYTDDLRSMRDDIETKKREAIETLDEILLSEFQKLGIKFEQATWDDKKNKEGRLTKRALTIKDIEALEPFHWGYEFDEIINKREGFDAIITNPPWEVFKPYAREFFAEHSELVTKKKMAVKEFEKQQSKLLQDEDVRAAWLEYQSRFWHANSYFRGASQYANQIAVVGGKKQGTDINLFKLFTEQCFNLLRRAGECGIVLPSGIYTDLGTTQLRQLLFNQTQITGLFCIENRKEVFEGVHRSFKFAVLTFQKGAVTKVFPAAFMRHDVTELEVFPKEGAINISVDLVRRISPGSNSVMEFKHEIDLTIVEKMLQFPLLGERIDGAWNLSLTREFHLTDDRNLFKTSDKPGRLSLYEGKMIHQFSHRWGEPKYWIVEKEGRKALLGRNVKDEGQKLDYQSFRLGFRDVASSTNERTMIASMLPSNVFAGNTIVLSKGFSNLSELLFAISALNSFCCDAIIRQKVTSHCNMFYVYQLPVPRLTKLDPAFVPIIDRAAKLICTSPEFDDLAKEVGLRDHKDGVTNPTDRARLRADLDGMIAHLYGLTEQEFTHVLSTFPIVEQSVKDGALEAYREFAPKPGDQEIAALIAKGESATLEFKSSARWDMKQNKADKLIEGIVVKTVAALLNSEGGALLLGVDDDRNVIGLAHDYKLFGKKDSRDAYENFLTGLLLNNLGKDSAALFSITFHELDGKDVCKVEAKKSPKPVFVKDPSGEHLYIRAGNSTRQPTTKEAIDYCKMHWPS
jgi:schlafen family protein/Eco57I restriction-modification methylase